MGDGGKGSAPRPITDWDKFEKNWKEIFNSEKPSKIIKTPPVIFVDSEGKAKDDCDGAQHSKE